LSVSGSVCQVDLQFAVFEQLFVSGQSFDEIVASLKIDQRESFHASAFGLFRDADEYDCLFAEERLKILIFAFIRQIANEGSEGRFRRHPFPIEFVLNGGSRCCRQQLPVKHVLSRVDAVFTAGFDQHFGGVIAQKTAQ